MRLYEPERLQETTKKLSRSMILIAYFLYKKKKTPSGLLDGVKAEIRGESKKEQHNGGGTMGIT